MNEEEHYFQQNNDPKLMSKAMVFGQQYSSIKVACTISQPEFH